MSTDKFTQDDEKHMRRALELAAIGEGRVSPNPPVGCVLVKNGAIIAEGWHDRYGGLHAEAAALRNAGSAARGATAYVTLSPCTTQGRQPPCAQALIAAGIAEVIIAAPDPNPQNDNGAAALEAAGIPVRVGLLREEAEYAARGFFKRIRTGLPYVTLKYAMTLDGKIATASGDSKWISNEASRGRVQVLRSKHDAVLTGIGTVLADDPLLNVRIPLPENHPQPARVVVDSRGRMPRAAKMLDGGVVGGRVIVAAVDTVNIDAEVWTFAPDTASEGGRVPLKALLARLAESGVNAVMVECGGTLAAALLRQGLIDEVVAFVAPKIVGGNAAPGPLGDLGVERMADAARLRIRECEIVEGDVMLRATLTQSPQSAPAPCAS